MQVFTLCFLFLAASLLLAPGIAFSNQASRLRNTAAGNSFNHQGVDREQGPIRIANISQQNFSNSRASTAIAIAMTAVAMAMAHHASKIGGRPEASQ